MERTKTYDTEQQILALETFSSDAFLVLNKRLVSYFGPSVSIFLCNLIDKFKYFRANGMLNEDGSFFLIYEDQTAQTGMSAYELRTCKNFLISKNIISTRMQGLPRKEYYYLHFDVLVEEFLRTIPLVFKGQLIKKLNGNSLKNLMTYKDTEFKENEFKENKITLSDPTGSDGDLFKKQNTPSLKERNKIYLPQADFLANIVCSTKNVKISAPKLNSWAAEIRKIVETDGVTIDRIDKALEWYKNNAGREYIPVIESGTSLRNKFLMLENAIAREQKSTKPVQVETEKVSGEDLLKNNDWVRGIKTCYYPFLQLLPGKITSAEECMIVNNMLDIRTWFQEEQKRPTTEQLESNEEEDTRRRLRWERIPDYEEFLQQYIRWLSEQTWLDFYTPSLLHRYGRPMEMFQQRLEKDIGFDLFTGRTLN